MITDESVERVREAADIVAIVGEYVDLKKAGADFRGPCPFHQGKHRNFSVSARKNFYHCFVCHESGDVFDFVRKHLGLDWPSAVRMVAEKSGVEVKETDGRRDAPDDREPLWEVLAAAGEVYRAALWDDPSGAPAREYLAQRGVEREAAEPFGLGFAPRDGRILRERLGALGFDDERLLAVGLLVRRDEGGDYRPRFRDRLMFPIADGAGHPVGFGGRLIGPGEPKYLNSPETKVFDKGRLLYHLHQAKQSIRREERVLVVEGYFDVLRLSAAGMDAVVAPLGTALTEAQAALVARYTRNAFLLYDSDAAGLKATFRAGLELLKHGVAVRVVTLPEGEDPDTFVATQGAERLERHVAAAADLFERQVQILERRGWFADITRKRTAVDKLLPTVRAAADPLTRDLYLDRLAERTGIERATLLRELDEPRRAARRDGGRDGGGSAGGGRPTGGPAGGPLELPAFDRPGGGARWKGRPGWRRGDRRFGDRRNDPEMVDDRPPRPSSPERDASERYLVLAMLHLEGQVEALQHDIAPERFRNANYAEIFSALVERGGVGDLESFAEPLSDAATRELQLLLGARGELEQPGRIVADSLAQLRYLDLTEQIEDVDRLMEGAVGERRELLEREQMRLRTERRSLGVRGNWARKLGT